MDTSDVRGKYLAEFPLEKQTDPTELVLNPNGQGYWANRDERVIFKWETKKNKIWLHTKAGGFVSGDLIKTDKIVIMLPGTGVIRFKKVSPIKTRTRESSSKKINGSAINQP
jgi:hypothetical protein